MAAPAELTYTNGAETTLWATLAAAATSATLADGTAFPTGLCRVTIWDKSTYPNPNDDPAMEIIEVTSRSTATLTLATRGVESTSDVEHLSGSAVRVTLTAGGIERIYDRIDARVNTEPATTAANTVQPSAADAVPLTIKAHASQTANLLAITTSADAALLTVDADGDITVGDGQDIAVGTTTGTKFGTAATQKFGFFNATPVVQPSGAAQAEVTLGNENGEIAALTFSATPTQAECEALRDKCEELADDLRAVYSLVAALRTAGVNLGLVKGGA